MGCFITLNVLKVIKLQFKKPMNPLYNFGLSQEDSITGIRGLDLTDGDSLLCIAGAGEVPICTAAVKNGSIVAVATSEN